ASRLRVAPSAGSRASTTTSRSRSATSRPTRCPRWSRATTGASPTPSATTRAPASALQQLLRDPLDVTRLDLALVGLHYVAHQAPGLLDVGDAESRDPLLHERAHRRLVHGLRQVALAEFDLEAERRGLGRPALARLLEVADRLLELLAVGADHVEHDRVVHRAREALGGAPLLPLRPA